MAKIYKVHNLVYKALVDNPKTRTDDFELILEILKTYCADKLTIEAVMKNHALLGVPSFATITRARRKIQETHPELIDIETKEIRDKEESEFRDYALNH